MWLLLRITFRTIRFLCGDLLYRLTQCAGDRRLIKHRSRWLPALLQGNLQLRT